MPEALEPKETEPVKVTAEKVFDRAVERPVVEKFSLPEQVLWICEAGGRQISCFAPLADVPEAVRQWMLDAGAPQVESFLKGM